MRKSSFFSKKSQYNKVPLPEGVSYPREPKLVNAMYSSSLVIIILSFIYESLFIWSIVAVVITIIVILTNKEYKTTYFTQQAIRSYQLGDIKNCKEFAIKALKFDQNNSSAKILSSLTIEEKKSTEE